MLLVNVGHELKKNLSCSPLEVSVNTDSNPNVLHKSLSPSIDNNISFIIQQLFIILYILLCKQAKIIIYY
jgi:hypothetical protein